MSDERKDVRRKYVAPSVHETAFNCPHCGALTQQAWFSALAKRLDEGTAPFIASPDLIDTYDFDALPEGPAREHAKALIARLSTGRPAVADEAADFRCRSMDNASISRCYNCKDIAICVYDRMLWPSVGTAPLPSADLPKEIRSDYDEASTILDLSPRGAAALLRLCIQNLCHQLGEKGKDLDADIAALVKKGLDRRIQRSLDIVRVIGNNAVHPGKIDLRDDHATAERLFDLVNLITEKTISEKSHIDEMYEKLPKEARERIEKRDGG